MKKSILAVMAICTATCGWAGSFDGGTEDQTITEPVAAYDWSGGYAGLGLGISTGSVAWEAIGFGFGNDADFEGESFSLRAGYDWQRGNFVFGGLIEGGFGTITSVDDVDTVLNCGSAGGCTTDIENYFSIRARVGRTFDRTLVFATVGSASADVTASTPVFGIHGEDSMNGWAASLGVEHAVRDNISVSAEYVHNDLGSLPIPFACGACQTDIKFGSLRIGANYRW
ncbi:outer membrane beta-barrel protein [Defluviimonas aestuarii]|uniref:outer membrane protein n=1 Tax=Albidovulum aestuarii TaxID=1130726 RepID=UPI00249A27A2|nr:outer membrane beta-barrel protein [Defluviimonas aestuarii]MDI3336106.1 outer membrane beta-barrel protein [Defluviimonas aestuarii]